jgi:hypothetical protein
MEALRPAASVRSRAGSSAVLAVLVGVLALPASAAAGPVEDIAQRATEPVSQSIDRAGALPAVRQVVERSTARVRPTVAAIAGSAPIRSTMQSVRTSVSRAAPQAEPAVATAVGRLDPAAPNSSSPSRYAGGHPGAGGIDRHASRRSGGAQSGTENTANSGMPTSQPALDTIASATGQARSDASSTSASGGDGGLDIGQPPFGFDGGGSALGGPAGVTLLALLGLLAAMLTLIPRFSTRMLHMSPTRWGLVAFLVPIERPG